MIRISDTKKNGKTNVFIRATENRKATFIHTGFDVRPSEWDADQGLPQNKTLSLHLESMLLQARIEFSKGKSIKAIKGLLSGKYDVDFDEVYNKLYYEERANSKRNSEAWKTAVDNFKRFNKSESVDLSHFTIANLEDFKIWLRKTGKTINSVSVYMRSIRTVYRKVCDVSGVELPIYPFPRDMVPKPSKTAKRSISAQQLRAIASVELNESESFYRDVWILLFCLAGIDLLDLAHLQYPRGEYIYFRRAKSSGRGNEIKILVTPQARAILKKYKGDKSAVESIEYKSVDAYRDVVKRVNYAMKKVAKKCAIQETLTTKVARHTFATLARNIGYDRELIGTLMGHQQSNVTDIYILYSQEMIDDALSSIISTSLEHHLL